jgi:hypothetical protein
MKKLFQWEERGKPMYMERPLPPTEIIVTLPLIFRNVKYGAQPKKSR